MKIKVSCDFCQKTIFKKSYVFKKFKHHFCNRLCMHKFYKRQGYPNYNKVIIYCQNCKKAISRKESHIKRNKYNFCDLKCRSRFYKINPVKNNPGYHKVEIKCFYCKKIIHRKRSRISNQKHHFCSRDCVIKYQTLKIEVSCEICNKQIFKKISSFKKHKHHFCSKKCYGKFIIGENNPNYKNKTKIFNKKHRKIPKIINPKKSQKNRKIKIFCPYCKKIIIRSVKRAKKNKNNFCSKKCCDSFYTGKAHSSYNKIKVYCEYCKKTIFKSKTRIEKQKHHFCNRECFKKWLSSISKIQITCAYCKNTFLRQYCYIKRSERHFCSIKCRNRFFQLYPPFHKVRLRGKDHHNWNNGSSFEPYGLDFNDDLKKFIRNRDQFICQNETCGTPEKECFKNLIPHHIDYNKKNNSSINLIALCQSCHSKTNFDRKYWRNYFENLQIKRKVHLLEKYIHKTLNAEKGDPKWNSLNQKMQI